MVTVRIRESSKPTKLKTASNAFIWVYENNKLIVKIRCRAAFGETVYLEKKVLKTKKKKTKKKAL